MSSRMKSVEFCFSQNLRVEPRTEGLEYMKYKACIVAIMQTFAYSIAMHLYCLERQKSLQL